MTVTLFKRRAPIPYEAASALSREFIAFYPEHELLLAVAPAEFA